MRNALTPHLRYLFKMKEDAEDRLPAGRRPVPVDGRCVRLGAVARDGVALLVVQERRRERAAGNYSTVTIGVGIALVAPGPWVLVYCGEHHLREPAGGAATCPGWFFC